MELKITPINQYLAINKNMKEHIWDTGHGCKSLLETGGA